MKSLWPLPGGMGHQQSQGSPTSRACPDARNAFQNEDVVVEKRDHFGWGYRMAYKNKKNIS